MNLQIKMLFVLTILVSNTTTNLLQQGPTEQESDQYSLLPEIETLIEKYQSPEFLEEVEQYALQFENPDFIHKALHPRESALEKIDRFNKTVLYELPFFLRTEDQAVGICYCDVIGVTSHFMQKCLDKNSISELIIDLSNLLTKELLHCGDEMIPILEKDPQQLARILIDKVWKTGSAKTLLINYLKRRLPFAALEYIKKLVTPPPFFIHGKTKEGYDADFDAERITPITSIIPVAAADVIINPAVNKCLPNSQNFQWQDEFNHQPTMIINVGMLYAVEGAKQLEFISDIDETLFFIVAKEMAISLVFFHRELYSAVSTILNQSITLKQKLLTQILLHHQTLQKNTEAQTDVGIKQKNDSVEYIKNFFKTALGSQAGELLSSLQQAQQFYNTAVTGILLTPAAFKIFNFCWKLLQTSHKQEGTA